MSGKFSGWDDTIAAIATPQGSGAIGVIRISGDKTFQILDMLFPSKKISLQPSHTLHVGFLKHKNTVLDEVVVSVFKSPKSYTAEDVAEISCHGSVYIQQQILNAVIECGARTARPGEFTQRSFLNGKMDLAQAEAVADIIASNSEISKKTALQNMRGGFSHTLQTVRDELLQFSALIELELDFSQEDIEFADRGKLYELLHRANKKIQDLIESFQLGNVIKHGVQVAIIGKPNAGKSTLLNTLLNEERAIVSDIAGTTRDTIEETININGILFRLIDTAGIREHTNDIIESMGVEKSFEKMRNADIVLYIFDVNETGSYELQKIAQQLKQEQIHFILAGNKSDIASADIKDAISENEHLIFISAKNRVNIDILKERLFSAAVNEKALLQDTIVTNARHTEALKKTRESLLEIIKGLDEKLTGDLLATDIKRCLYYIGEITGEITNEDQLDYIFSKFCIGK